MQLKKTFFPLSVPVVRAENLFSLTQQKSEILGYLGSIPDPTNPPL